MSVVVLLNQSSHLSSSFIHGGHFEEGASVGNSLCYLSVTGDDELCAVIPDICSNIYRL